jgi:hypothetical protein
MPRYYILFLGTLNPSSAERRPSMSDGGSNRLREEQIDTESVEPPCSFR